METRRQFFIKTLFGILTAMSFQRNLFAKAPVIRKITKENRCKLYRAINGKPADNLAKVIELIGGVEKNIGTDDVVLIKPNLQWWNHGAPNLSALKMFVDLVMSRTGGFNGEIVIAENCHRGLKPWEAIRSGWVHSFNWNCDLKNINNMNDLCTLFKKKYGNQFSVCHWIDVGAGAKRVFGPGDGTGYVYCDGTGGVPLISLDNGAHGDKYRAVIMSYPIFRTDKGTIIDFKNGIWNKGAYTEQPLKFINFSALNHHSQYCGATSALKNYLGINDISGGPEGPPGTHNGGILTKNYYNFHQFPYNTWESGPVPGMLGAEIGVFLKTIRKADLNITTAEWIGMVSRIEPPIAHTRAVLLCKDPVALDYHATKYILYPNSRIPTHNPDNNQGSLYHDLIQCAEKSGYIFDEKNVAVVSYDFNTKSLQDGNNLVLKGDIKWWGNNIKSLTKYMMLRFL
jgi:hypothetical protein